MLLAKQSDDLPEFGRIKDIVVICGCSMFYVEKYSTVGINNHLMCHAIVRTHTFVVVPVSNLADSYPYSAHTSINDGHLYIAMRSEVVLH